MSKPTDSLAAFYAHALAIEREAAERYAELADAMDEHHNDTVAALFRKLGTLEAEHAASLEKQADSVGAPRLAPWEFDWQGPESPEAAPHDEMHYRMTPYQGLEVALANEQRAVAFFEEVARHAADPRVRALAAEFAAEEQEHVGYVMEALSRELQPDADWALDLDPPNPPA